MGEKMKKKTKYIVILVVVIFLSLLGITSHNINKEKNLNFFEKTLTDTTTFIEKIFYTPIGYIKNKIKENKETKEMYKKYKKLENKAQKTEIYKNQIKELQKEVAELKSTLDLNSTLSEYTYVNATVVNRNIGYWYNLLTIDKGSKNGIKLGDAVITNEGLIGKIINVSNFSSSVKLMTTDEIQNKISIKIENNDEYLYGLLVGYDKSKNVYKIEGITDSDSVKEGNTVTTTGLTDYFPSGIPIGKVSKIVKDEYDLNSIVEVIPTVDFENISIVTVLNRKAKES